MNDGLDFQHNALKAIQSFFEIELCSFNPKLMFKAATIFMNF